MNKPLAILAAALALLLIFWAGFVINFPGEALSRVIADRLNRIPNVDVQISPASLGLASVQMEEFRLDVVARGQPQPVLMLKGVRIPFSWALFSGLPVRAGIGQEGQFDLFMPWDEGEMTINGTQLRMEDIPGFSAWAPARLKGGLSFSGQFQIGPETRQGGSKTLPKGVFTAKAEAVRLENLGVMGTTLPLTRFDRAELVLKTGSRIEVEKFALQGDVQGGVTGFIQPRLTQFSSSPMQLKVAVSFKQAWMQKLGVLQPLVAGFLKNGRLEASLRGSVGKP